MTTHAAVLAPPLRPHQPAIAIPVFRRSIGPALVMLLAPVLIFALYLVCTRFDGSLAALASADAATIAAALPQPTWRAAAVLAGWVALQTVLLVALPGR